MLNDIPTDAMTVPRLIIKGQKVSSGPLPRNPFPFPQIVGIILPLISLGNYPAHINKPPQILGTLTWEDLHYFCGVFFPGLFSPSEMNCILSMKCLSLLSLYYGLLLNSFLHGAKDLHWTANPRASPRTWPPSHAPFSCNLFTKDINKSTSCLSLSLLLNTICAEI